MVLWNLNFSKIILHLAHLKHPVLNHCNNAIWNFTLENDDYYKNYGIYANCLLIETTSKRFMKKLSNLKLK